MRITFLGTSAGVPTKSRNVSSVALRLPQRAEVWLFDCGEATQHQILRSDLKISQIRRIFITHLHGDHLFGLMGLLSTCGLAGHAERIDVYGPPGLDQYVRVCGRYTETHYSYPVEVHTVGPGLVYEDDEFVVACRPLEHRIPAFGYRVNEKERPGHFDAEKAASLGIPAGPLYGRLKRGERITLPDGRQIDGAQLCGPPRAGRRIVYCTDTTYCESAVELAEGADVLIHEATFANSDLELARQSTHSTSVMAAEVASAARVKQLIITHVSPRYGRGNDIEAGDLLEEARAVFPNTELAYDLMSVEVTEP